MRLNEELARNNTLPDLVQRRRRRTTIKEPPEWELRVPPMPKTRTEDWTKPPTRLPYKPTDGELKPTPLPNKDKQPEIILYSGEERRRTNPNSTEDTPVKSYETTIGGWSSTPTKKETAPKKPPESELRVPPMPEINEPAPKSNDTATQTKKRADIAAPQTDIPALERSNEEKPRSTQESDYFEDSGRGFSGGGRDFSDPVPKPPESELHVVPMPQTNNQSESSYTESETKTNMGSLPDFKVLENDLSTFWSELKESSEARQNAYFTPESFLDFEDYRSIKTAELHELQDRVEDAIAYVSQNRGSYQNSDAVIDGLKQIKDALNDAKKTLDWEYQRWQDIMTEDNGDTKGERTLVSDARTYQRVREQHSEAYDAVKKELDNLSAKHTNDPLSYNISDFFSAGYEGVVWGNKKWEKLTPEEYATLYYDYVVKPQQNKALQQTEEERDGVFRQANDTVAPLPTVGERIIKEEGKRFTAAYETIRALAQDGIAAPFDITLNEKQLATQYDTDQLEEIAVDMKRKYTNLQAYKQRTEAMDNPEETYAAASYELTPTWKAYRAAQQRTLKANQGRDFAEQSAAAAAEKEMRTRAEYVKTMYEAQQIGIFVPYNTLGDLTAVSTKDLATAAADAQDRMNHAKSRDYRNREVRGQLTDEERYNEAKKVCDELNATDWVKSRMNLYGVTTWESLGDVEAIANDPRFQAYKTLMLESGRTQAKETLREAKILGVSIPYDPDTQDLFDVPTETLISAANKALEEMQRTADKNAEQASQEEATALQHFKENQAYNWQNGRPPEYSAPPLDMTDLQQYRIDVASAPVDTESEDWRALGNLLSKKYDDDFWGQFGANVTAGSLAVNAAKAATEYLDKPSAKTLAHLKRVQLQQQLFSATSAAALDNLGEVAPQVTRELAQTLPERWEQTKAKLTYGVPLAVFGAIVAGTAGAAGGGIGAIPAAIWGAKEMYQIGAGLGSSSQAYQSTRGATYLELLELGVDEKAAHQAANDKALIASIMEVADAALSFAMQNLTNAEADLTDEAKESAGVLARVSKATTDQLSDLLGSEKAAELTVQITKGILNLAAQEVKDSIKDDLTDSVWKANNRNQTAEQNSASDTFSAYIKYLLGDYDNADANFGNAEQQLSPAKYAARGRQLLEHSAAPYRQIEVESLIAAAENSQKPNAQKIAKQARKQMESGEGVTAEMVGRLLEAIEAKSP